MSVDESWRPVIGFEGLYEVSDLGRVRSLWRSNGAGRKRRDHPLIMRPTVGSNGYISVGLSRNGKLSRANVHRLVLGAFVGPCPDGKEAAHIDGVRSNCRLSNLTWKIHRDNIADKVVHGTHQVGERNPASKLTKTEVITIRRDYRRGSRTHGAPSLGRQYGVCPSAILAIVKGVNWSPEAMAAN